MTAPGTKLVIFSTKALTKTYPDGQVHALCQIDLEITRGQFVAIMGPSGSGKSTLLNLLGALDSPTSGDVFFEGTAYRALASLDRIRSEKLGYVFQSFHLLSTLTAAENVQIPMFELRRSPRERQRRALELLEVVGLGHRTRHLPSQLSVGERQRVSIARALANDPVVLLADEPTGNLDSRTGDEVLKLFERLHQERNMTLVIVTHSEEVARRAQRTLLIRDGQVVADIVRHEKARFAGTERVA